MNYANSFCWTYQSGSWEDALGIEVGTWIIGVPWMNCVTRLPVSQPGQHNSLWIKDWAERGFFLRFAVFFSVAFQLGSLFCLFCIQIVILTTWKFITAWMLLFCWRCSTSCCCGFFFVLPNNTCRYGLVLGSCTLWPRLPSVFKITHFRAAAKHLLNLNHNKYTKFAISTTNGGGDSFIVFYNFFFLVSWCSHYLRPRHGGWHLCG